MKHNNASVFRGATLTRACGATSPASRRGEWAIRFVITQTGNALDAARYFDVVRMRSTRP